MLKTKPTFHVPTVEDAAWAIPILTSSEAMGCEFSFATQYMWRNHYHTRIAQADGYFFACSGEGDECSFLPPVGPSFEEGVERLAEYVKGESTVLRLHSVTEEQLVRLREIYGERLHYQEHRDGFDYIYRSSDLAHLPGKDYHSKKNHISAFSRKYEWQYEPLTDDTAEAVLSLVNQWCAERGSCQNDSVKQERCGVRELLKNRKAFGVQGGLLRVDGNVVAATFGSPINHRVFDVHIEKALSAYSGAYAVINREFALRLTDQYEYLNREDDMGIEGLRKAKLSYRPAILLKKFSCEIAL